MMMEKANGHLFAVMTDDIADKLGVLNDSLSLSVFNEKLDDSKISLYDSDYIFYYKEPEKHLLLEEKNESFLRILSEEDVLSFEKFQSSASEKDLDEAYVELDHWAVFGALEQSNITCAASMYPWESSKLADVGVLTLEQYRGKGLARKVVRAISRFAYEKGYEPQYRCQLDNKASIKLARSSGYTLYGKWQVISPESNY